MPDDIFIFHCVQLCAWLLHNFLWGLTIKFDLLSTMIIDIWCTALQPFVRAAYKEVRFLKFFEHSFLGISHKSFFIFTKNKNDSWILIARLSDRLHLKGFLYLAFLGLSWFPLRAFRTKALNQLVLFLDSPFIQLAAPVNKVLMSSSAILLSQCFLAEGPIFEGFLQRQRKKNFFFFSLREWLNMTGLPTLNHWLWDAPRWLRSPHTCSFPPVHAENRKKKIKIK